MGLLAWLTGRESGRKQEVLVEDESLHDLSLKDAIHTHKDWTRRLDSYVRGLSNETLDYQQISPDNLCTLGSWIHNTGREQFSELDEWHTLRDLHAQFHQCAGDIILQVDRNNKDRAKDLLEGELSDLSDKLQMALAYLYRAGHKI